MKVCLGQNLNVNTKKLVNLMWLIMPLSLVISAVLTMIWCELLPFPVGYPEYKSVAMLYGLSAIVELASEPLWLISQINLMVKLRAIVEAFSLFLRIILSTILFFQWPQLGIYAFGISQLAYCIFISASYFIYFYYLTKSKQLPENKGMTQYQHLFPDILNFEIEIVKLRLVTGFIWNCTWKQLLTEGERYMMTVSGWVSLEMQGDFDVVTGLGSLAPRLLFSAVEDSCQLAFSRLMRPGENAKSDSAQTSFTVLTSALKVVGVLGLTIVVFAQAYSWPLLVLYAGWDRADNGAGLLRVFSLYVLILAVNGVTECFYYSAIGQEELWRHTYRMMGFSVVFLCSGSILVTLYGPVGIIWANCINMLLRISISTKFIGEFYEGSAYSLAAVVKQSVPHATILVAYLLSLLVTLISMIYCPASLGGQMVHISVGLLFVCVDVGVILCKEQAFWNFVSQRLKLKKS